MWNLALQGQKQGLWFWGSVYVFLGCAYSLAFQIATRFWPYTKGALAELEVEKIGGTDVVKTNQEYASKALYTYHVSGVAYEGTRISPWIFVASHNARSILKKQLSSIQRFPDDRVKVFYNPKNPKKSFLIVAGDMGIGITLLIAVLPIVLFYLQYHG